MKAYEKAHLWLIGLAGESKVNPDGSSRQEELANCRIGEPVLLMREPDNRYDKNAVRVDSCRGVTIGYIPRGEILFAGKMDAGIPVRAIINDITGGYGHKMHYGCIIRIRTGGKNPDLPIPRKVEATDYGARGSGCAPCLALLTIACLMLAYTA